MTGDNTSRLVHTTTLSVMIAKILASGFHVEGGVAWNSPPPPPPQILNLSIVRVIEMLLENFVPDYVRSNLNSKFSLGVGGMLPGPPSKYTHISHATTSCYQWRSHVGARALATSGRAPAVQR